MEKDLSQEQNQREVVTKSPKSFSNSSKTLIDFTAPNPSKSPKDIDLSLHQLKGKIQKRLLRSSSGTPLATNAAQCSSSSSQIKRNTKLTSKDQQMNRLVFQEGGLPDRTEVVYKSHGKELLKGYKWARGIFCFCCNTVVSPSQFEAHAGQASRKKPYGNIFLANGLSLHDYASSLKLTVGHLSKKNDELCGVCKRDGDLVLCDGCPRSFHKECVSDTSAPGEKWFCKYCRNSMNLQHSELDQIEQIAKRCIQIDNCDLVACCICRAYDFTTEGFDDRTVIVCDQCEREYHVKCLREHKKMYLKELPSGNWYCSADCGILNFVLERLVECGPVKVPHSLTGLIRDNSMVGDANGIGIGITNSDMKWIVLRGKNVSDENRVLLSQSVDIFHKCFNPIVDSITGSDFIPSMAYGQIMGDSDFTGVHCAMLTIESKVITAGMFRVFGTDVVELPIVATNETDQGKGYFQLFFNCFEKLLAYLTVKKMIVHAAEDVESMWIQKFGFQKVTPAQRKEYRQTLTSMVAFQGTSLLEKDVVGPHGGLTFQNGFRFSLSMRM
ncbi:increased DNA methylation 1 [Lactuca sativa]|uniref:PHD-type domain-containing protein n=1 Tax=Lactuca sativa TaxID=4236 RepID=A0A9R1V9H4_LACSA|nr:increased DNA methylation 1 [Lactuca sativa]XP_023745933.1 increased DNA methylation 1 [Lactuca sativa]XP_023745934.1 increased DNA methylation 1 [Lactuca sativa]KAJ0200753.1 hypothetical protein LSAT_V11C600309340 [Lactuca sativa]